GAWRLVYANLFGGATMYMLSSLTINVAISLNKYHTGSLYDLPLISSFLWFAFAGFIAYRNRAALDAPSEGDTEPASDKPPERTLASRFTMAAVISLPVFAIYTLRYAPEAREVRDYRLMTTLIASVPLALIVFLRTHIADKDRARLLEKSEQSIENL